MQQASVVLIALAVLITGSSQPAAASNFHSSGVAHCDMCHTIHNSQDGEPVDADHPEGNTFLLKAPTPSDVCLTCHAGFISETLGSDPLNPPDEIGSGNYVFLYEDNINDGHGGATNPIVGDASGHNIIAPSYNLSADATLETAPGGDFPSDVLGCTSCHDPHGNMSFRMLNGAGTIQAGVFEFENPAFEAEGLSVYHGQERNNRHTAYQSGVSAWCANCHGEFHESDPHKHVTGFPLQDEIASNYNLYNGTEDITGGDLLTAYLAAVPFEDPSMTFTSTMGPSATSKVMCLTCHRAHASSAPDAGRWDFQVTFLDDDGVESGSYPIPNPYASPNQRSLCNKCHMKDEGDRIIPPPIMP